MLKQLGGELAEKATKMLEEAKQTKFEPVSLGISFGISFFLTLALYISTKAKEDSFITFGVFVYTLITGLFAVLLKHKPIGDQFPFLVMVFSVMRVFFEIKPISVLLLSLAPVLVNIVDTETQKHLEKNGIKIPKPVQ
eukprot:UN01859